MHPVKKMILMTLVFCLALSLFFQNDSEAALCAFRNPDRDVYVLFPEATGYRSVIKILDNETREKTETFLGQDLDYDEYGEHTFYLILNGEKIIGIIRPHAEHGMYGIVEMIWALTPDGEIIDFLIQRSREKGTRSLKSDEFHGQFRGETWMTPFTEDASKKINIQLFKPVKGAEGISSIVAYSAKKNLFLYKLFFKTGPGNKEK